jgi:hypothetical protein
VIVVGRVASIEATDETFRLSRLGSEYELGLWRAKVTIKQVIKGQPQRTEIVVGFPGTKKGENGAMSFLIVLEQLNPGEMVVLLLCPNKERTGTYVFTNPYKSAIRIADSPGVSRLLEAQPPAGEPVLQIAALLVASLKVGSREMVEQTLTDLVNLQGKQAAPAIKALLDHSKDPAIRGEALSVLIRVGDYSRLKETVEFVSSGDESDPVVLSVKINLSTQMSLVSDADLVAKYYLPLLRNPSDFVRQDAAYAIRHAKLRSAAPQLIEGLEDSDLETRYQCLMGLAETMGWSNYWAPSKELFEQNERGYIRQWKTWWHDIGQFEFRGQAVTPSKIESTLQSKMDAIRRHLPEPTDHITIIKNLEPN